MCLQTGQASQSEARLLVRAQQFAGPIKMTSLRVVGTSRQLSLELGRLADPAPLTMLLLLPGSYLRENRRSETLERSGVSNGKLLNGYPPNLSSRSGSYESDQLSQQWIMARLFLAFFVETQSSFPLSASADPTSPDKVVRLMGPDGRLLLMDFDTGEPWASRLRYRDTVSLPQGSGGSVSSTVEVSLELGDYKAFAGRWIPHQLTTTARGVVLEEIRIDRLVVNPPLTSKDFEGRPPKWMTVVRWTCQAPLRYDKP